MKVCKKVGLLMGRSKVSNIMVERLRSDSVRVRVVVGP